MFRLNHGKLNLTNVPVPEPEELLKEYPRHPFAAMKAWFSENSRSYQLISETVTGSPFLNQWAFKLFLKTKPQAPDKNRDRTDGIDLVPHTFRTWKKNYDGDIKMAWQITEEILKRFNEKVTATGADFMVFYVPAKVEIYDRLWTDTKRKYDMSDEQWNRDQVWMELEKRCLKNGIELLNPVDLLRLGEGHKGKDEFTYYFKKDWHWTARGHQRAGEIVADYVISKLGR